MRSFTERLTSAQEKADLTISDLAVWFGRPRSTVNTWINGRTPQGPSGREAVTALGMLEWAITKKKGLPVPPMMSSMDRPGYVEGTRDTVAAHYRVPALHPA